MLTHQSAHWRVGNTVTPSQSNINLLLLVGGGLGLPLNPWTPGTLSPLKDSRLVLPSPDKCSVLFRGIPNFRPSDMLNPFQDTSIMLPMVQRKPSLSLASAELLDEGKWPAWFVKTRLALVSTQLSSLGDSWDSILWYWTVIEAWQGYKTGQHSIGLAEKAHLHLAEVEWWQKCKCVLDNCPHLRHKDLRTLSDAWWTWWKALQPE